MKIQKFLSQSWVCSRRKAEEYVSMNEVYVNGELAHIGQVIDPEHDAVTLWDKAVKLQQSYVYYKFNKPRSIETTCAQKDGQSIVDIIDTQERVFPVWRLDKDTTGLILLTNDGRITQKLTHPSFEHQKEYVVECFWKISDEQLTLMARWVKILWRYTKKCKIERVAAGKFHITLTEGRNRQIRRMVESVWSKVKKLKRIRIENIHLWKMKLGELSELSKSELLELWKRIKIPLW